MLQAHIRPAGIADLREPFSMYYIQLTSERDMLDLLLIPVCYSFHKGGVC